MPSIFVRRRDGRAGRPISSLVQESCSIALGLKERTVDRARESINILCSRYNIVKQSSNNRQTILSISCFLSRFTHVKRETRRERELQKSSAQEPQSLFSLQDARKDRSYASMSIRLFIRRMTLCNTASLDEKEQAIFVGTLNSCLSLSTMTALCCYIETRHFNDYDKETYIR